MSEFFSSDDLRFWVAAVKAAQRVVAVNPEHEETLGQIVGIRGLARLVRVVTHEAIPREVAYVFDADLFEQAMRDVLEAREVFHLDTDQSFPSLFDGIDPSP